MVGPSAFAFWGLLIVIIGLIFLVKGFGLLSGVDVGGLICVGLGGVILASYLVRAARGGDWMAAVSGLLFGAFFATLGGVIIAGDYLYSAIWAAFVLAVGVVFLAAGLLTGRKKRGGY